MYMYIYHIHMIHTPVHTHAQSHAHTLSISLSNTRTHNNLAGRAAQKFNDIHTLHLSQIHKIHTNLASRAAQEVVHNTHIYTHKHAPAHTLPLTLTNT